MGWKLKFVTSIFLIILVINFISAVYSNQNWGEAMGMPNSKFMNIERNLDQSKITQQIKLSDQINSFGDNLRGQQISGMAGRIFGNEKINLHVTSKEGEELVYGLTTKDKEITNFQNGALEKNTLNVYADENEIKEIINSNNPLSKLEEGLRNKKIVYTSVGFTKKIKFTFVSMIVGILNLFSNQECENIEIYVDSAGEENGIGTKENPFNNISKALDYAKELQCQNALINIDIGDYSNIGRLDITMNTEMKGYNIDEDSSEVTTSEVFLEDAYIVNTGEYNLKLKSITISGPGETNLLPGVGVEVNNENAYTELDKVIIQDAVGNGIKQTGGKLIMNDVSITGTDVKILPFFTGQRFIFLKELPDSGAGIFLGGGVEAILTDIDLVGNENGAMIADGKDTKVYAKDWSVWDNYKDEERLRIEPTAIEGVGIIEVRNRALLLMEDSSISTNYFIGLLVQNGGRSHVRRTNFFGTSELREPLEVDGLSFGGGINILVRQRLNKINQGIAELEISDGVSTHADSTGFSITDAVVKISRFNITDNSIGVRLSFPNNLHEFEGECMSDNVFVKDNGQEVVQSEGLSLPEPRELVQRGDSVEIPEHNAICADVPFRCTWC